LTGAFALGHRSTVAQGGKSEAVREDELSFEQLLEQLERVVETLERGDAPLEQALSTFERGVALSRLGARRLDEAERRIEILLSDEGGLRTAPLAPLASFKSESDDDE
jgi:exodeoxyribonuclease VII small subunit